MAGLLNLFLCDHLIPGRGVQCQDLGVDRPITEMECFGSLDGHIAGILKREGLADIDGLAGFHGLCICTGVAAVILRNGGRAGFAVLIYFDVHIHHGAGGYGSFVSVVIIQHQAGVSREVFSEGTAGVFDGKAVTFEIDQTGFVDVFDLFGRC